MLLDLVFSIDSVVTAVGMTDADYYPFYVLAEYLDTRLYETIRIRGGLAYSPVSELGSLRDYGVYIAHADVELDRQDQALAMLRAEIAQLQVPLDEATVELAKRKLLLQMVQGYESNSELADYYADAVFEYETGGGLVDQEARIAQVTAADLHRVATRYLPLDRAVVFREVPTLTYSEFYLGLVLLEVRLSPMENQTRCCIKIQSLRNGYGESVCWLKITSGDTLQNG